MVAFSAIKVFFPMVGAIPFMGYMRGMFWGFTIFDLRILIDLILQLTDISQNSIRQSYIVNRTFFLVFRAK
jgi:hypothetical protein